MDLVFPTSSTSGRGRAHWTSRRGYRKLVLGRGQKREDLAKGEILLEGALDALEQAVAFVKAATPDAR